MKHLIRKNTVDVKYLFKLNIHCLQYAIQKLILIVTTEFKMLSMIN